MSKGKRLSILTEAEIEELWGSRDFPSKNDKVLWKPRHLWPLEGYYFFHIPILALIG